MHTYQRSVRYETILLLAVKAVRTRQRAYVEDLGFIGFRAYGLVLRVSG